MIWYYLCGKSNRLQAMNVQKAIKEKGYTLAEVAKRMTNRNGTIGITQPTLSAILNNDPQLSKLREIADIIGVPLSELVSDSPRLTALVKVGEVCYQASTIEELEAVVEQIKKRAE